MTDIVKLAIKKAAWLAQRGQWAAAHPHPDVRGLEAGLLDSAVKMRDTADEITRLTIKGPAPAAEPQPQPPQGREQGELKPCPFCGGEAEIGPAIECGDGAYVVSCPTCNASSMVAFASKDDPRRMLMDAWNRRTQGRESVIECLRWLDDKAMAILRAFEGRMPDPQRADISSLDKGTLAFIADARQEIAVKVSAALKDQSRSVSPK